MKKVIVSVCLLGVATVAAQAQGIGTVNLMNYEAAQYNKERQAKVSAGVERAVVFALRNYEACQKQQEQTQPAAQPHQNTIPGTGTTALINYEATLTSTPKKKTSTPSSKKKGTSSWGYFKAYVLGQRLPGETEAQYRARLTGVGAISNQAFK